MQKLRRVAEVYPALVRTLHENLLLVVLSVEVVRLTLSLIVGGGE